MYKSFNNYLQCFLVYINPLFPNNERIYNQNENLNAYLKKLIDKSTFSTLGVYTFAHLQAAFFRCPVVHRGRNNPPATIVIRHEASVEGSSCAQRHLQEREVHFSFLGLVVKWGQVSNHHVYAHHYGAECC